MKILKWKQFNENKSREEQLKEITDSFDKPDKDAIRKKQIKDIVDKFDFDEKPKEKEDDTEDGFTKHLKKKYGSKNDKI
jgi:hypothetical protein